jgi:hypothetical protein
MRYKIAVNPTIRGKLPRDATPGQWARFNDTFDNCELTAAQIATAIQAGHAIAPWHAGRRKRDNWQLAQHIGIDLDDGALSWDEVTALPLVDQHAAIVHMTASSTPAHPRMRVLFLLDEPCDDPDTYTFIVGCFLRAFATADPHCSDPSRLFFGAPGCSLLLAPDNIVTSEAIANIVTAWPPPDDDPPPPRSIGFRTPGHAATRPRPPQVDHGGEVIPPAHLSPARRASHAAALLARVHHAPDGAKWATLRDIAITFGGYVAGGYYSETEARQMLRAAIETRRATVGSMPAAYKTIDDGLAYGQLSPLHYLDDGRPDAIPPRAPSTYYTPHGAAVGSRDAFVRALIDARVQELETAISAAGEGDDLAPLIAEYDHLMRAH